MLKNTTFKQKKYIIHTKNIFLEAKDFIIKEYSKLSNEEKKKIAIYLISIIAFIVIFSLLYNIINPGNKIPKEIYQQTTTEDSLYQTINADKKVVYINLKNQDNSTANIIKSNIENNQLKESFGDFYYLYADWDKNPGCGITQEICAHKFFSTECEEVCIINPIKKRYITIEYKKADNKIKRYKKW